MKTLSNLAASVLPKKFVLSLAVLFFSFLTAVSTFAQTAPEKVDVDINADGGSVWYGQPWVWAVGVAIFIVIIVAITRSNNKNA